MIISKGEKSLSKSQFVRLQVAVAFLDAERGVKRIEIGKRTVDRNWASECGLVSTCMRSASCRCLARQTAA